MQNLICNKFNIHKLYYASLKNASLLDTSFLNSNLRQADLTGTRFYFAVTDQGPQTDGMKLGC